MILCFCLFMFIRREAGNQLTLFMETTPMRISSGGVERRFKIYALFMK